MSKYSTSDGKLLHEGKVLGPVTALFEDSRETEEGDGIIHMMMPHRLDFVFVAGDRVVGLESKTEGDLVSSWYSRRLQRQVRTLLSCVDVPVLFIKLTGGQAFRPLVGEPDICADIAAWQMHGGLVAVGSDVREACARLKTMLEGAPVVGRILAGRDVTRVPTGGTVNEQRLQRLLRGCGPVMSKRLLTKFGTIGKVLSATAKELKNGGATRGVIAQVKEMRE